MDICHLACAYRTPSGYCGSTGGAATCPHKKLKQTNADRVRSMTDRELAMIIGCMNHKSGDDCFDASCFDCTLEWLQEEVK